MPSKNIQQVKLDMEDIAEPKTNSWTRDTPTVPGIYLLIRDGRWPCHCIPVKPGDWRRAQNPAWLYAGDDPTDSIFGWWFGPIPRPPSDGVISLWGDLP